MSLISISSEFCTDREPLGSTWDVANIPVANCLCTFTEGELFYLSKKVRLSIWNAAGCHLAWIRISQMIKCCCGILASESLGSGRFPYSHLKCQDTYNLHCGCFTVGLSPLSLKTRSRGMPQHFPVSLLPYHLLFRSFCVGCNPGRMTAGVFPAFLVVPWIATRYLGELHNLTKPLKFHHLFLLTSRESEIPSDLPVSPLPNNTVQMGEFLYPRQHPFFSVFLSVASVMRITKT